MYKIYLYLQKQNIAIKFLLGPDSFPYNYNLFNLDFKWSLLREVLFLYLFIAISYGQSIR